MYSDDVSLHVVEQAGVDGARRGEGAIGSAKAGVQTLTRDGCTGRRAPATLRVGLV